MNKILYISLTGMTEPLGRSQVLEYLVDLSKNNKIFLISYEREKDLDNIKEIEEIVKKNNIEWKYFIYSNKYGVFSSINQVLKGVLASYKYIKENNINIIHARSFIPAFIGYILKKFNSIKLIYDIRGFAIDEKLDRKRLKRNSMLYKILKFIDDKIYINSNHIVTLTYAAKEILINKFNFSGDKITVIPTCVNKDIFKLMDEKEKKDFKLSLGFSLEDKIIIHTGTVSGWYDFESELKLIKYLIKKDKSIYFLILNKNEKNYIKALLERFDIKSEKVKILSVPFTEVYKYLNISDFSLFFIHPTFSKQASAPTKFAENVVCHLPSITNKGVGDMEYYINNYDVGILVDLKNDFEKTAEYIYDMMKNKKFKEENFDKLFKEHFDKNMAVKKYNEIYKKMEDR